MEVKIFEDMYKQIVPILKEMTSSCQINLMIGYYFYGQAFFFEVDRNLLSAYLKSIEEQRGGVIQEVRQKKN